jgi:hypothetical protein
VGGEGARAEESNEVIKTKCYRVRCVSIGIG